MASSAVEKDKKRTIGSSRSVGDDFASILVSLFATPDLEESEEEYSQLQIEVDDLCNNLVARHNLSTYFEKARAALRHLPNQGSIQEQVSKSVESLLDYRVPRKPLLERDGANDLYLRASRAVELQHNLRLAFWVLAEQQRNTIREYLSRDPGTLARAP